MQGEQGEKPRGNLWWRCNFELVKDGPLWVIRPVVDSFVEFYLPLTAGEAPSKQPARPDDEAQNWAPHVSLARVRNEKEALAFANKWGLLGLWAVERYRDFIPDGARNWYEWELPSGSKPLFASLLRHQEPLEAFLAAVEDFQTWLDNLQKEQAEGSYGNHVLPGCLPRFGYDATSQRWSLDWEFNSLLEAIYLRTALDMAGKDFGFRRCAKCNRYFLAGQPKDRFCSYRCQNNFFASLSKRRRKGGEG